MNALRIAVDARVVATDVRGIGRYARAILSRLIERDDVAVTLLVPEWFPAVRRPALSRALGSSRFKVSRTVPRDADVSWFPANGTFFASRAPVVVTLHDAAPFRYPNPDAAARAKEQEPIERSARDAAALIAVSAFGQHEICEVFGVDPARVTVIHHGVDAPSPAPPLDAHLASLQPYALFVGRSEFRKGVDVLVAAFRRMRANTPQMRLVLAGPRGDAMPAALPDGVVELGFVNDERLDALYAHAEMFVFPSRYEGFGLPLLEAMTRGTPVVAARAGAIPEVTGDAAELVEPDDDAALEEAMRRVHAQGSLARDLRERGLRRAAAFLWDESARRHLELFRRTAR